MAKLQKKEQVISILIHLPQSINDKIQKAAEIEMRDRKNHIQKILIDYANKLPTS